MIVDVYRHSIEAEPAVQCVSRQEPGHEVDVQGQAEGPGD
jgi:hypothetical protein